MPASNTFPRSSHHHLDRAGLQGKLYGIAGYCPLLKTDYVAKGHDHGLNCPQKAFTIAGTRFYFGLSERPTFWDRCTVTK